MSSDIGKIRADGGELVAVEIDNEGKVVVRLCSPTVRGGARRIAANLRPSQAARLSDLIHEAARAELTR